MLDLNTVKIQSSIFTAEFENAVARLAVIAFYMLVAFMFSRRLKLVSTFLITFSFFHQMIALQKL